VQQAAQAAQTAAAAEVVEAVEAAQTSVHAGGGGRGVVVACCGGGAAAAAGSDVGRRCLPRALHAIINDRRRDAAVSDVAHSGCWRALCLPAMSWLLLP
jgi:hypothetical protein